MPQPVSVARELFDAGLPLRRAHKAINCLASGESFALSVASNVMTELVRKLGTLGVIAREIRQPAVDLKQIREAQSLSQLDFATRYCLDVGNVQNWEQGRYAMDKTTEILLAIIRDHPGVVDQVLTVERLPAAAAYGESSRETD